MDVAHLVVKIVIAIACAGCASILVPRRIPGGFGGLMLFGLAGVWFGEWAYWLMVSRFQVDHPLFRWNVQGVLVIPAVLGSAILLYLTTTALRWLKYGE